MIEIIVPLIVLGLFLFFLRKEVSHKSQSNYGAVGEDNDFVPLKTKALNENAIRKKIPDLPKARVVTVVDGDTVIISKGRFSETTIRLDSIDCPEDGQYWGDTAKYGLIKLIGGSWVHVEEHGFDNYGRTLATIYTWDQKKQEWLNVNERMVTLGHAWVMRKFYDHLPIDRQNKLNRLEKWSKSKEIGLWHQSNPVPPWQWRNQTKTFSAK